MYEEGIRIPLLIHAPWAFSGARDDLVTQADLAPTLASLSGVEWPKPVTGHHLSKGRLKRDVVFLEYYAKQKWINPIRTIRTRRWKLNWYDAGNQELLRPSGRPARDAQPGQRCGSPESPEALEARLDAWRGPISAR